MKNNQNDTDMKRQKQIINKLLKKTENKFCADCKINPPSWASINLGVFICIYCSSCHRELGAHISKIKSINLDTWPSDSLENFQKIDNKIANDYWEYNLNKLDFENIKNDKNKVAEFIKNKYEYKKWINTNDIDPMKKINQPINNSSNNEAHNFNWNYFSNNKNTNNSGK